MNDPASCDPRQCCPSAPVIVAPPGDDDRTLASLAKAVGHPARIAILRLLDARQSCICGDIAEHLPLAQSTVSQHLKQLKDAGLIRGTISGPRTYYCIDQQRLKRLKVLISGL